MVRGIILWLIIFFSIMSSSSIVNQRLWTGCASLQKGWARLCIPTFFFAAPLWWLAASPELHLATTCIKTWCVALTRLVCLQLPWGGGTNAILPISHTRDTLMKLILIQLRLKFLHLHSNVHAYFMPFPFYSDFISLKRKWQMRNYLNSWQLIIPQSAFTLPMYVFCFCYTWRNGNQYGKRNHEIKYNWKGENNWNFGLTFLLSVMNSSFKYNIDSMFIIIILEAKQIQKLFSHKEKMLRK